MSRRNSIRSVPAPTVVIMAAGQGTRMRSATPKVLHDLCGRPLVGWPVAAALLLLAVAFVVAPRTPPPARTGSASSAIPVTYAHVASIVAQRCAVCHAAQPSQPGFSAAPAGVLLDTPENVRANSQRIYAAAVASHAMPLGNLTHMTDAERATLGAWIRAGAKI